MTRHNMDTPWQYTEINEISSSSSGRLEHAQADPGLQFYQAISPHLL